MVPDELLNYIKNEKKNNVSNELIFNNLKNKGWDQEKIIQGFEEYLKEKTIKPKSKKNIYIIISILLIIGLISAFYIINNKPNKENFFEQIINCSECQYEELGQCYDYNCCNNNDCFMNNESIKSECINPNTKEAYCFFTKNIEINNLSSIYTINKNEKLSFELSNIDVEIWIYNETSIRINNKFINISKENNQMDINNNGINDFEINITEIIEDQINLKLNTITTTTTTTTTTSSTTTTTVKEQICYESKMGLNIYEYGCIYEKINETDYDESCDYCLNETRVRVYFCYKDLPDYIDHDCEGNCTDGACRKIPTTTSTTTSSSSTTSSSTTVPETTTTTTTTTTPETTSTTESSTSSTSTTTTTTTTSSSTTTTTI